MAAGGALPEHPIAQVHHEPVITYRSRCLVLGDAAVGKTALIRYLTSRGSSFPREYSQTVFTEFSSYPVKLPRDAGAPRGEGQQVDWIFADVPGAAQYNQRDGHAVHWASAGAAVLVFDVANRDSFQAVSKWLRRAQEAKGRPLPCVLIGAKSDLRAPPVGGGSVRAEVPEAEARALAASLGLMGYFEASAETGKGVEAPFAALGAAWLKLNPEAKSS